MVRDIYMAKNIEALDVIAYRNEEASKRLKEKKLDGMYKAADRLYKSINDDIMDEEKTYVYTVRYLRVIHLIFSMEPDKKFLTLRFGNNIEKIKNMQSTIRDSLVKRYFKLSEKEEMNRDSSVKIVDVPEKPKFAFGKDKFISSKQLYDACQADVAVLVMDARTKSDYDESHLKYVLNVNISEEFIIPGLSANVLASKLPVDARREYDRRDTFEFIVLLDWDTTSKTLLSSKLQILLTILTVWDVNKNYKHPPYILNGGYMDFIDVYPTFSSNPHVIYNQKYSELDELLDLDTIQYPTVFTGMAPFAQVVKATKPELSAEDLLEQLENIVAKQLKIEIDLLNAQSKLFEMENTVEITTDNSELEDLIEEKGDLEGHVASLETSKIITVERKNILTKQLQPLIVPESEKDSALGTRRVEINKNELKIAETVKKRKKLCDDYEKNRAKPLDGGLPARLPSDPPGEPSAETPEAPPARLVPKSSITGMPHASARPIKTPAVNRSTKPPGSNGVGLVGLQNIRNTCYMNSIIQSFRHVPVIKDYFCKGVYYEQIKKREPAIIYETAQLIRTLWNSKSYTNIKPTEFYLKIGVLNPLFQEGNHEDCMEFFMVLFNHLSEDCAVTIVPQQKYNSAKLESWCFRLSNTASFFIDNFYHQIQLSFVCSKCGKKCQKFELENTFMLPIPDVGEFYLEDLMDDYLLFRDDDVEYFCTRCELPTKDTRNMSYYPKVAVILLKRYKYENGNIMRMNNTCHFPLDNLKIGRSKYKLWSIAMHQGTLQAGHYTAACLNRVDQKWYEYNDEHVREMDIDAPYVKVKAYLLFYQIADDNQFGFDYGV